MAAPQGWVSPQWQALSRRPLILGLPYGAAGAILLLVGWLAVVMYLWMPALVMLISLWLIGAAITRYDPWGWEIMLGAMRMPRVLRVA
jgi:type IV secretory pathway VirB3-like protein